MRDESSAEVLSGVALPIAASLSSSSCVLAILRPVVSATRPVFTRDATRGATSTDGRSTEQHDFGIKCFDNFANNLCARFCYIVLQHGIVNQDNLVSTIVEDFVNFAFDIMTQQYCYYVILQIFFQSCSFTNKFQTYVLNLPYLCSITTKIPLLIGFLPLNLFQNQIMNFSSSFFTIASNASSGVKPFRIVLAPFTFVKDLNTFREPFRPIISSSRSSFRSSKPRTDFSFWYASKTPPMDIYLGSASSAIAVSRQGVFTLRCGNHLQTVSLQQHDLLLLLQLLLHRKPEPGAAFSAIGVTNLSCVTVDSLTTCDDQIIADVLQRCCNDAGCSISIQPPNSLADTR